MFDSVIKSIPTTYLPITSVLGVVFISFLIVHYILPIFSFVYRHFLRPSKNLKRYGEWAVITGATDGIGRAYAFELAKRGLNILLVSRTPSKLAITATEIKEKVPSATIKTCAIDFSQYDAANQHLLAKSIEGLDIGILINNVGQSYDHPDFFHCLPSSTVQSLIDLNIKSTTLVTHLILPHMVQKKRGAIVNISSAAGLFPSPLLAEYSAAKAYVDTFSRTLYEEYRGKGISVQTQNPLFVSTKLAKIRNSSLTVPSPAGYARVGANAIGYEAQISPYWAHSLQLGLVAILPQSVAIGYTFSLHQGIRKKALKKKENTAKKE